jgi:hypothetical protein
MKRISYVLFFLFLTCFACEKEENNNVPDNGNDKLKIMDIADAQSLFIASANHFSKKSGVINQQDEDTTVLFKITEDGFIREVKYYDKDSTRFTMQDFPSGIWDVNSTFLIVQFSDISGPAWAYLVNKNTEKAWLFDQICLPGHSASPFISTDNNDNIYFIPSVSLL